MENQNPIDHVFVILEEAHDLSTEQKADAWDAVYESPDISTLDRKLSALGLDRSLIVALVTAKRLMLAEGPSTVELAAQRMSRITPQMLDLMERHPRVLSAVMADFSKKREPVSGQRESSAPRNEPETEG